MKGLLGRLMQKLSETFGGPHTQDPDSLKRAIGGYPARKLPPGDPDSPTITGGYPQDFYENYERNMSDPRYQHLYEAMGAVEDMVNNETGVTDYSGESDKDFMDINVRDFVKGSHSVNPPDTTKNIDKLIAPKKEPDALLKAIMRFGPTGSMKDWS